MKLWIIHIHMGVPEVIGYEKEGKTEQGSVYSIYLYIYLSLVGLHDSILHTSISITVDAREYI